MNAVLIKRLFRAIHSGSKTEVDTLCQRIVEEQKKLGHEHVASDLQKILESSQASSPTFLSPLPTSRRDSTPLIHEIPVDQLRHHMVLSERIEKRFQRIEKEFSARSRLATHGLKPRRKILLYGPPGCGKNLGAERLAWNTGLPIRKVRFDSLLSSYFGETVSNLRKVFDAAQASPCALFLDECDTLARSRSARNDVGEVIRITNSLLDLLENFKGDGLVIAATNLDSSLDKALFRRFDEVFKIPLPGLDEIVRLFKTTLSAVAVDKSIHWKDIAREMDGMSCSDVAHIAQNAAKHCVLEGRKEVTSSDIRFALEEIQERHRQAQ